MSEHLSVEARGQDVVLKLGDRSATLTPREAQRFAYQLARAYMRAGGIERVRGSLKLPERGQK